VSDKWILERFKNNEQAAIVQADNPLNNIVVFSADVDVCKQIVHQHNTYQELVEALSEIDKLLDRCDIHQIGNESSVHRKMKNALKKAKEK